MMSKEYTFNPGDFVVYPAHGVGQVTDRQTTTVAGQSLDVFSIHFTKEKMTMKMTPKKALDTGLRQIATPIMMETVEKVLQKKTKKKHMLWSKRSAEYTTKINSGDPIALAEVLSELYTDRGDAAPSKRQHYDKAMGRLVPEYAIVKNISETEAQAQIETILQGTDSAE